MTTATGISAGYSHTCLLLTGGTVKCLGSGANGRLGTDSTSDIGGSTGDMVALTAINLGQTATAISAGYEQRRVIGVLLEHAVDREELGGQRSEERSYGWRVVCRVAAPVISRADTCRV